MWFILSLCFHAVLGNVIQENTSEFPEYNASITTLSVDFYNTTEFLTGTDCNFSTCSNSTTTPILTSTTTTKLTTLKKVQHEFTDSVCLCDLLTNICDINCCCDRDCSYEKKRSFHHCESLYNTNIDRRACKYLQYDYVNFTVHEWEIQNNDLFCVVKNNMPPSYTIQKKEPFKSYEESVLEKDRRYEWPETLVEIEQPSNYSQSYIQGLPIWVILDNVTIDKFKVSEAFISSGCNIQKEAKYLHEIHNECVHAVHQENQYLDADYYNKFLFIARPNKFNSTKSRNKLLTCSGPICLKSNLKICSDIRLRNCSDANDTNISLKCSNDKGDVICENVVNSLRYVFYHEGIEGIKQINLSIHLVNITFKQAHQYEIEQSVNVEFQWADAQTNFSNILSGNPGYLIKKPILIGTLINDSIVRNPDSYKENFMVLPYEDMGICEIGEELYQPIEFGYNTILQCKIRNDILVLKNTRSLDICKKLQVDVFKYWNILEIKGVFLNRTFGYFGNANSSITDDWKEMLYEKPPKHILDRIFGKFSNKNRTLICSGMVFGLSMDIYHARVDLKKIVDQEKILGVTHRFHSMTNISISFNVNDTKLSYEFDLDTRVTFWDVTSQKMKKLVDPPSLNIKLPSDFFYPFVKLKLSRCFISSSGALQRDGKIRTFTKLKNMKILTRSEVV